MFIFIYIYINQIIALDTKKLLLRFHLLREKKRYIMSCVNYELKDNVIYIIKFFKVNEISKFKTSLLNLKQYHYFHMVSLSPWPLIVSLLVSNLLISLIAYIHNYISEYFLLIFNFIILTIIIFFWLRDVIREGTLEGMHTVNVKKNLRMGFGLFIVTEIMFFFGFFWSFFHSSFVPVYNTGIIWPPVGMNVINPYSLPLVNTALLLQSGAYLTLSHFYMKINKNLEVINYIVLTLVMGFIFTCIQGIEYYNLDYNISDGIYGTTFFLLTGFHGVHVIIGWFFIFICFIRYNLGHFTSTRHVGFECAVWYWHFVDIVWLLLFFSLYVWGNSVASDFEDYLSKEELELMYGALKNL